MGESEGMRTAVMQQGLIVEGNIEMSVPQAGKVLARNLREPWRL